MLTGSLLDSETLNLNTYNSCNYNTLILAPRQSGKTTVMLRFFLANDDIAMLFPNSDMKKIVSRLLTSYGCHEKKRHLYCMDQNFNGLHYNTGLVDELCSYSGDMMRFYETSRSFRRLIAITTPHGPDRYGHMFRNVVRYSLTNNGEVKKNRGKVHLPDELFIM